MSKSTKGSWNRNNPKDIEKASIYCQHNRFKDKCEKCKEELKNKNN
jgi:hypothetical protein